MTGTAGVVSFGYAISRAGSFALQLPAVPGFTEAVLPQTATHLRADWRKRRLKIPLRATTRLDLHPSHVFRRPFLGRRYRDE